MHPRVASLAPSGQFTFWQSVLIPTPEGSGGAKHRRGYGLPRAYGPRNDIVTWGPVLLSFLLSIDEKTPRKTGVFSCDYSSTPRNFFARIPTTKDRTATPVEIRAISRNRRLKGWSWATLV